MSKEARAAAAKALDEYCRRGVWGSGASKLSTDEANATIDAYLAALAGTHVMVPREPTEAMICAGALAPDMNATRRETADTYRAMLAASQVPPEPQQRTDRDDSQD